ncbi:MAG TPA: acetate kinase [Candidatus Merdicola faecigallinarum]|uniref:Acetate kinase n=1 Tax=Candidatus Merdicola faecigallinarum TaxID=2840862 RepID=A0A9D1LZM4_9FIRM|nr:acetate kinase [Candidatus Merdicola faecigallinarum]
MKILVLNSGSSSLKYQVIDVEKEEMLVKGNYERIGQPNSFLTHKVNGVKHKFEHPAKDHEEAIQFVMKRLLSPEYGVISSLDELAGIGHRVVHGGEKFKESVIITDEVIKEIKDCASLAPLHNPAAVLGIEACRKAMPTMKMVAVFDTAFHQTLPKERYIYPIPYRYYEEYGVRKYGFHGTSHQYVAERIAKILEKPIEELKIINCHLGQGASVCAIQNGKSVETSMGLTPLAGIPMGTRSGDIDPSIVTYLIKHENLTPDQMENILNKESGAYGVSQISVDFRDIEAEAAAKNPQAILALANYNYLVACYIARCAVAMGGVDVITFTAGVGEKGLEAREAICSHLTFLGVKLDLEKNNVKGEEREISSQESKVKVYIVPTNEELMIAKETLKLVKKGEN